MKPLHFPYRSIFAWAAVFSVLLAACTPTANPMPTTLPLRSSPTPMPPLALPLDVVQSSLPHELSPNVSPDELQAVVEGNRTFAFDFYQAVRSAEGNLFYSPHSLSTALAMTYAGARANTQAQMAEALHFTLPAQRLHPAFNALALELDSRSRSAEPDESGQRFQLNIVNAIWGQQGFPFEPDFLDTLAVNYGSGLRLVDFATAPDAARRAINDWVSQQTNERIEDLIPAGVLDELTRLVLVNAIYFNASWMHPFDEDLTQDEPFYRLDNSQVSVPMMRYEQPQMLPYARDENYQAVELPYLGGTTAMTVLLPEPGAFAQFEASLDAARFEAILGQMSSANVMLTLPRFSFSKDFDLNKILMDLGMRDAFSPGEADFSGMDGQRDLYIGAVLHKAFVNVDEAGTEAAAATAVVMSLTSIGPTGENVILRVDRPFIFVIRDVPSGAVLFVGRVLDPTR